MGGLVKVVAVYVVLLLVLRVVWGLLCWLRVAAVVRWLASGVVVVCRSLFVVLWRPETRVVTWAAGDGVEETVGEMEVKKEFPEIKEAVDVSGASAAAEVLQSAPVEVKGSREWWE